MTKAGIKITAPLFDLKNNMFIFMYHDGRNTIPEKI